MSEAIITQTKLEWRIAAEAADFDLELDCWTVACADGWIVYGATADECEYQRIEHERITRKHAECNPEERGI
jgi:hypothetical protein